MSSNNNQEPLKNVPCKNVMSFNVTDVWHLAVTDYFLLINYFWLATIIHSNDNYHGDLSIIIVYDYRLMIV